MICFDNLQPFCFGFVFVFGETMVEEYFYGGFLAVGLVRVGGDETDETACLGVLV